MDFIIKDLFGRSPKELTRVMSVLERQFSNLLVGIKFEAAGWEKNGINDFLNNLKKHSSYVYIRGIEADISTLISAGMISEYTATKLLELAKIKKNFVFTKNSLNANQLIGNSIPDLEKKFDTLSYQIQDDAEHWEKKGIKIFYEELDKNASDVNIKYLERIVMNLYSNHSISTYTARALLELAVIKIVLIHGKIP